MELTTLEVWKRKRKKKTNNRIEQFQKVFIVLNEGREREDSVRDGYDLSFV